MGNAYTLPDIADALLIIFENTEDLEAIFIRDNLQKFCHSIRVFGDGRVATYLFFHTISIYIDIVSEARKDARAKPPEVLAKEFKRRLMLKRFSNRRKPL